MESNEREDLPKQQTQKFETVPGRLLPKGQQWVAHCGKAARMRYLRQTCSKTLKSKNLELIALITKLRDLAKDYPAPEYILLHLIFKAQESTDQTGVPLEDSLSYLVDQLETAKQMKEIEEPSKEEEKQVEV